MRAGTAEQFFQRQMDYIFFFYGFSFILLAAICVTMRRDEQTRLPWTWLGLFGITHGISEWLEMLRMSMEDVTAILPSVRLAAMVLSYVFLFEFGREGFSKLLGKGPGRWVYIPLLAFAIAVSFTDLSGLNPAFRYSLGLTGGLWSALSLFLASQKNAGARRILAFSALCMACYALATGAVVPMSSFFPASAINSDSFLSFTGLPIQLVRGILAILIAGTLLRYSRLLRESGSQRISRKSEKWYELQLVIVIVIVLACGWIFTELAGRDKEEEELNDMVNQARIAAAALNPERVRRLVETVTGPDDPDYVRVREQLRDINAGSPALLLLYLMSLKGEAITFLADSSSGEEYVRVPPARGIHRQPARKIEDALTSGEASAAGPYTDKNGTFVFGFAPVRTSSGKNSPVLGIDIDADSMQKTIKKRRAGAIFITLLISLLCAVFFVVRQRLWESAQRIAASEKILAEAQKVAHLGSWTYDTQKDRLTWSEEMFNIFGLDPGGSAPDFSGMQEFIPIEDREKVDETLRRAMREGWESELEFRVMRPDGDMRHVFLKVNTMLDDAGVQMLGICQDITERKQGEEELRHLSVVDELTGLNNRRGFLILATQQLKIADRSKQGAVLVYADMDNMKWVNDTLGHKEGDRALIDIANILKSGLRPSDIVARWGGDEFVGLALESSEKAGEVILARLQERLGAHNLQGHRPYKLSISFGLTGYDPENPCALEELLDRGDKLMYEEKQRRKMQQI